MKKLSFIYILFCASIIANAQIQHEDFNTKSLPNGWTTVDSESGYAWEFGYKGTIKGSGYQNPASFESGGVYFNDSKYSDTKNNRVELISPSVNLTKMRLVEATIEITYNLQTFSNDGKFTIDVWDGKVWQNVLIDIEDTNITNSGKNQTRNIDVSKFINSDFKVKFVYDDENSLTWGMGIDDYKLKGIKGSGIDGLEDIGFNYYPNPVSNDELTLMSSKEITMITIYNAIGQVVMSRKPSGLETKLDMQRLASGTYLVQVIVDSKKGNFKVIKK